MKMIKSKFVTLSCIAVVTILSGCNTINHQPKAMAVARVTPTLADIELSVEPLVKSELDTPSVPQLIKDYQELAQLTADPELSEKIASRLAQLLMIDNEHQQEVGSKIAPTAAGYFDNAILAYEKLVKSHPGRSQTEQALYQLAKAYELQGEGQLSFNKMKLLTDTFPDSQHAQELYFRSGEYLFTNKRYQEAARSYQQVISGDSSSPYYQTSLYMQAWSQFKLENQEQALLYFTQLLDLSLPQKPSATIEVDALPLSTRQLIKDTLRIMGLIFSYQDGVQSLASHFERVGGRYYEYLNYQNLAQLYLSNKRYRDSALTYGGFVERYPSDDKAPHFAIKKIQTYQRGKFPSLVTAEKRQFIASFGSKGDYWRNFSAADKAVLTATLKSYLVEFAKDSYRNGQNETDQQLKKEHYTEAAAWLLEYIDTFNDDKEMAFLYAESLYGSEQYARAITAYKFYAYQLSNDKSDSSALEATEYKPADAGYSVLLAYKKLLGGQDIIGNVSKDNVEALLLKRGFEASAQQFVDRFGDDKRSIGVLEQLMNQRFKAAHYSDAIVSATRLIEWPHAISQQQKVNANIIIAHSIFNRKQYREAAASYHQVLGLMPQQDPRANEIKENYAASLFKQAEQLIKGSKTQQGIDLFITIIEQTPESSIRKLAQFNAAQYLYQLDNLTQASDYLEDFRRRFKNDPLGVDIATQLISIYEKQQDWSKVATEYLAIADSLTNKSAQQEPLYLAASYFEKAKNVEMARLNYRRHAKTYQQPFERAVEIRFKLSEIYNEQKKGVKRRFWLNKLIELHDNAGAETTARSAYLAAMSAMVFANDTQADFNNIKLKLPLRKSLKRKKRSLTSTLKAYQKAANYHVATFTTESTFQMAQIYRQLAKDLIESERPKGLDQMALEQYEILLEEQAYPFEDQAIAMFESNTQRSWQGLYDVWIKKSFDSLATLMPGRYSKEEILSGEQDVIY